MRLILKFELKNKTFPSDYRRSILSVFKKALGNFEDGRFLDLIYNNTNDKGLVWGIKFPKGSHYEKDSIVLKDNKITIIANLYDTNKALMYYVSLLELEGTEFNLPHNTMVLKKVYHEKLRGISEDTVVFRTISPICIREHTRETNKDYYFAVGDKEFNSRLVENILSSIPTELDTSNLIIKHNLTKKVTKGFGIHIQASDGDIYMKGNPNVLDYIYKHGIGAKRGSGYGMVEVVV